jgi:Domain of unknown function (DUF4157)/Novel toxin 14
MRVASRATAVVRPSSPAERAGRSGGGERHGGAERQARASAAALLRGERGLAGRLGSTPAAEFQLPTSRGERLPADVRTRLEYAFDATLDTVRIHRDDAAHAAVAEVHARAFTAGPDIYFRRGAFEPDSESGLGLLAHEVAHVLQQTGRTRSDGRVEASPKRGSGDIQRQDDDSEVPPPPSGSPSDFGTQILKELEKRHRSDVSGSDDSLERTIAFVDEANKGSLVAGVATPENRRLISLAADDHLPGETKRLSTAAKGFLLDCLKTCETSEHHEAAFKMLGSDRKSNLRVALVSKTFQAYLMKKPPAELKEWLGTIFDHPDLAKFWPQPFLRSHRQFLFNPSRKPEKLPGLEAATKEALKHSDGSTGKLGVNDRLALAWQYLFWLDTQRVERFIEGRTRMPADAIRTDQALSLAYQVQGWTRKIQRDSKEPRFFKEIAATIDTDCQEAIDFWGKANARLKEQLDAIGGDIPTKIDLPIAVKHIIAGGDEPVFEPMHRALAYLGVSGGVLELTSVDGELVPFPPAEYARRVAAFKTRLGVGRESGIEKDFRDRALALWQDGKLDGDLGLAIGWGLIWCAMLERDLNAYDEKKDRPDLTDERFFHRFRLGLRLGQIGLSTGWNDLLVLARQVTQAQLEKKSRIVIRGHWIPEDVPVSTMPDDFPAHKHTVFPEVYLTATQLVTYFQGAYLASIAQVAEDAAAHAETTGKAMGEADVKSRLTAIQRPQRYKPEESEWILQKSDIDKIPISAFLKQSRKTQREVTAIATARKLGPLAASIAPSWTAPGRVFVWLIPDLTPLIQSLRSVPFLRDAVAAAKPGPLNDAEWLQTLSTTVTPEDVLAPLRVDRINAKKRTDQALRRLTAAQRRLLAAQLTKQLRTFAGNRRVENFTIPSDVVLAIERFYQNVVPPIDAEAQTAALVLALAPALLEAFPDPRYAIKLPPQIWIFLEFGLRYGEVPPSTAPPPDKPLPAISLQEVVEIHKDDPSKNDSLDLLRKNRSPLAEVRVHLETARGTLQERFGFKSEDGKTLQSLVYYPTIEPGPKNVLEIGGDDWVLQKVHRPFTYHPALGGGSGVGRSKHPILKDSAGNPLKITGEVLATFLLNGEEFELKADDEPRLAMLSRAIEEITFGIQMGNLAEIIQESTMLIIDVVELVPGVGQELMAARVSAQTVTFLAAELPLIIEQIEDDPIAFIKDKSDKIRNEYLSVGRVIEFVLLEAGDNPFQGIRRPADARQKLSDRPTGKLGRVIQMLRRLGARLADAVKALQRRFRGPFRRLQSEVGTRPKLAWLLRKALDMFGFVTDMLPPEALADLRKSFLGEESSNEAALKESVKGAGADFKEKLGGFLVELQEFELPREIVPLGMMVELILDFALSKMGAKVRIIKRILQATGHLKALSDEIAKQVPLKDSVADPNRYWRTLLLPEVEEGFRETRNAVVDQIYNQIGKLQTVTGIDAFRLDRPAKLEKGELKIKTTDFPEAELFPSVSVLPPTKELSDLPVTAGEPLAVVVRGEAEHAFDQDFGHVRLHSGPEAEAPLDELGAHGMTSGSHVYLRPGLSPSTGLGERVLKHELVHVLQQTGSRPLGRTHDERPVRGRRGAGVRLDAAREAAAEAISKSAEGVRASEAVGGERVEGVQPLDATEGIRAVLERLTLLKSAKDFEIKPGKKPVPGLHLAEDVWKAVLARLKKQQAGDFPEKYMKKVIPYVVKQVEEAGIDNVEVGKIAALAQDALKTPPGEELRTELNVGNFAAFLEAVVFAESGIILSIKLKGKEKVELVDLKATYVHLGNIQPGPKGKSPLWDAAIDNSKAIVGTDDPEKVRYEIHARLAAMGPDPFIWSLTGDDFEFSAAFIEAFRKVRASRDPKLEKDLPAKSAYLKEDGQTGVGLRIGGHKGQKGTDRQSHHMTQYLLVQYFRNDNSQRAWKSGKEYPGITPASGQRRERFSSAKGSLELQALDSGGAGNRGLDMPAILLATDTHQRGQLHISRESSWESEDDDAGPQRQGYAIDNEFARQLHSRFGIFDSDALWNTRVRADKKAAAEHIFDAMTATYHWMHGRMFPALDHALVTRELAYYRGIASRLHIVDKKSGTLQSGYDLTETDIRKVYQRAREINNSTMSAKGWKI